jgi:hypothetical protein
MSSPQKQFPQPGQSDSPISPASDAVASQPVAAAENSFAPHLDSPSHMISPASSTSAEVMLSNVPPSDLSSNQELTDRQSAVLRQQPIPPASEPMQYRAIGLIYGKYEASVEQFTRGMLITEDGTAIDAVLLGRVMSLVKKHLDLEQSHLWVVYPRTRNKTSEEDNDLHMQIVGVWEPEKLAPGKPQSLNGITDSEAGSGEIADREVTDGEVASGEVANGEVASGEAASSEVASGEAASSEVASGEVAENKMPLPDQIEEVEPKDGYFSIRGEVLFYAAEEQRLIVKIQQSPRPGSDQGKAFKLNLNGALPGNKSVGYFWDLQVQRQENLLVVQEGSVIGLVPPKKRKPGSVPERRRPGGGGAFRGQRPSRVGDRSASPAENRSSSRPEHHSASAENRPVPAPPARREPIAKPIKRPKNES